MRLPAGRSAAVRVPATSANLGPGFDACGLALAWYDDVSATTTDGEVRVEVHGEGSTEVPRDDRHLVLQTIRQGLHELGATAAGLALVAHNTVPHGRGLGSSAAALVAGLALAWGLARPNDPLDRVWLLTSAARLEGHPDNVAAATLGGYTIAWSGDAGARAVTMATDTRVAGLAFVPDQPLPTHDARNALPERVPFAAAAANAGRAALLTHAVTTAPQLLPVATQDWLHQAARASRMTKSYELVQRLRGDGLAAVISGAGPTVLVLGEREALAEVPESVAAEGFRVRLVEIGRGVTPVSEPSV